MGLSAISPVQMQSPAEEGCSTKRKPEDYLEAMTPVDISGLDTETDNLRHDKLMAELRKKFPIPSRKKPNCATGIDRSVVYGPRRQAEKNQREEEEEEG